MGIGVSGAGKGESMLGPQVSKEGAGQRVPGKGPNSRCTFFFPKQHVNQTIRASVLQTCGQI